MPMRPTAIDLFCGAGGLSVGLEMAGFDVLAGFDADAVAHRTYVANHGASRRVREAVDVTGLGAADVWTALDMAPGGLDVVAGGPPCQGFSTAGNRDAADERNALVFHFARLVGELRPRLFVMENVVGLLSMRTRAGRPVLEALGERFGAAGYRTNIPGDPGRYASLVVNAADHGVPQRRRRVLVFGACEGAGDVPRLPPPSHHDPWCLPLDGASRPHVTVREAIGDLPEPSAEEPMALEARADLSEFAASVRARDGRVWNHIPTRHKAWMIPRMRAQRHGEPLYDTWAHAWVRLCPDEPAPTVKENHNAPSVHPDHPRVLTPRECARLQSFPDWFRFEGTKSRQLVQVGNAVPPLLGRAIGHGLRAALDGRARSAAGLLRAAHPGPRLETQR
jgi:DNA (cytosine-5)-methyltransferase 1